MLDVESIRAQFPALHESYNGRPAIFFDNPGGTQVSRRVIDAMTDYLVRRNANTHGLFETSKRRKLPTLIYADLLAGAGQIAFNGQWVRRALEGPATSQPHPLLGLGHGLGG